jgi:DNA topoisomerase-2
MATIEDKYKKMSHHEHILKKPDMYIGSIHTDKEVMNILNNDKITKTEILFNPALYKLYDEVLVNARDHTINCSKCTIIKINIDKSTDTISVYNNGDGIPIEIHKEHKIYVPELIFGNLLTSTNYGEEDRITGGKYGLGIKLTNIWSSEFTIETNDKKFNYSQTFTDNMFKKSDPIITKAKKTDQEYTKITFRPDLKKLGMKTLTDNMIALFKKRAYDISVNTNKNVKVYFNNELIQTKLLADYIKLHYTNEKDIITYEKNGWQVGVVVNEQDKPTYVSFVNGICTYKNGKHLTYILNQLVENISDKFKKKQKMEINDKFIKDNIDVFIIATIVNPDFQSQSKDVLKTPVSKFGTECVLSGEFFDAILNTTNLIAIMCDLQESANLKLLNKSNAVVAATTTRNKHMILDIPKLEDAQDVLDGKKNKNTIMIFTEGDSAKTFALNGRTIVGHNIIGVFPLKGKMLNARNCTSIKQYLECEELKNINMILGLKHNTKYKSTDQLRYSKVLILTDQDVDGAHIKGLFINYIQCFWPELLLLNDYIHTLATPLIKVYKKADKNQVNPIEFYSEQTFNNWVASNNIALYQKPQYYKGLGTSSQKEAKELFKKFNDIVVSFKWDKMDKSLKIPESKKRSKSIVAKIDNDEIKYSPSYNNLRLVFEKDYADQRKEWLSSYDINDVLDYSKQSITYSEFIEKDMKHFSNYDNLRSIPSILDGFKACQRKILYVAIKEKLFGINKNKKVALLAASVSEKTAYKHGETSLCGAVINMGQRFINSNNLNFLAPKSEFGTRRAGGADHGAPRYIFCWLNELTTFVFRKEDECILTHIKEEGMIIEPEHYFPIIPTILLNGAIGIGTGYSTNIPLFNPEDVIYNILSKIKTNKFNNISPWYKNFKGTIKAKDKTRYIVSGKYTIVNDTCKITELPVDIWYDDYKAYLYEKMKKDSKIINIICECDNDIIKIDVVFNLDDLQTLIKNNELEKYLKLISIINLSNMYMFDVNNNIKKYDTVIDIFEEFYAQRLIKYKIRKEYYLEILKNEYMVIFYRVKFINQILNKEIIIERKNKKYIIDELIKYKYPKLMINLNKKDKKKKDDSDQDTDGEDIDGDDIDGANKTNKDATSYDYLTKLNLFVLTTDQIEKYNEDLKRVKDEMDKYSKLSETNLWENELNELLIKYKEWVIDERNRDLAENKVVKTKATKKAKK